MLLNCPRLFRPRCAGFGAVGRQSLIVGDLPEGHFRARERADWPAGSKVGHRGVH